MASDKMLSRVPPVRTPPPKVGLTEHTDRHGRAGTLVTAARLGVVRYAFFPHMEKPGTGFATSLANEIVKRHADGYDPLAGLDKEVP